MPRLIVRVSEEQKALWVEQAYAQRITLSEWIRQRCDGELAAGDPTAAGMTTSQPEGVGRIHRDAGGPKAHPSPSPAASSAVARDVSQEHNVADKGSKQRGKGSSVCPHRVPLGSYCKKCEEEA